MPIKECSLYTFTVNGTQTKTTPKDITARAAAEAAQTTANGKQDALTAAQLAAVNSGVTAEKVATYDAFMESDPTVPAWAKQATKPTYTASEVGALPDTTAIPAKTSDLTNDSGFMTSYTETDPTVPAWAKAASKPTYTASEVGALPDTTAIPAASSASPEMDGTAAAGSSADYARADHIHPSDSSKQDVLSTTQMNAVNSGMTAEKVSGYDALNALSTSYTSQNYVNNTDFNRIKAYRVGLHLMVLVFNLHMTASLSSASSFIAIGKITGIAPYFTHYQTIAAQGGTGKSLTVQINTSGIIKILSPSAPADEWFRATIPVIVENFT